MTKRVHLIRIEQKPTKPGLLLSSADIGIEGAMFREARVGEWKYGQITGLEYNSNEGVCRTRIRNFA